MEFTTSEIIINEHRYNRGLVERIISDACNPTIENIVVDGFCGIGGVTSGFEDLPNFKVIACINHWDVAIETHQANHPDCLHLLEDFRSADIQILRYMIDEVKKGNPSVKVHLWLSLECTNFSNAKGGMSRDADSRTLADHAPRYFIELKPDVIWIENVKEFLLWGPMIPKVIAYVNGKKKPVFVPLGEPEIEFYTYLIEKGVDGLQCPLITDKKKKTVGPWMIPDPYRKGEDFDRWKAEVCGLGYQSEHRIINCADHGVPQHRVRLFMQFTGFGLPAVWPIKTHDKKGRNGLPKWVPVRGCLDLEDEGESVLSFVTQKGKLVPRIKSEATITRLMEGCDRHVLANDEQQWIVKYLSNSPETGTNAGQSLNETSPTATAQPRLAIATTHMIDHYFGNGYTKPVSDPAGVSGTKDGISLHCVQFLSTYHSTGHGTPLSNTAPAVMTKDKHPLVSTHFVDMQYGSGQQNKSIDETSGAILGNPKQRLVEVDRLILDTQFNNSAHSLDQPARTQTANRKHFYLVNFQWFNKGFSTLENPANTLVASMGKVPNYLLVLETGELALEIFPHDPPHYVKLKKFMAERGIIGINMRMLNDIELLKIMSMKANLKLHRSSTKNKKMIGNAVPPEMVRQLGACYSSKVAESVAA